MNKVVDKELLKERIPTIIALIMLVGMLGLMSNCSVIMPGDEADEVPWEYNSPMETNEHLNENGKPMPKRIVNYEYQREKQNP
tara:strand:- start:847 stop:1095 length:249 start_codon:yes stop_codon:yes gene_type:complete